MIDKYLYVIRDDVSGECGDPMCMPNDDTLNRALDEFVAQLPADNDVLRARVRDSSVYCIGRLAYDLSGLPVVDGFPARLVRRMEV